MIVRKLNKKVNKFDQNLIGKIIYFTCLIVLLSVSNGCSINKKQQKPNILFIAIDDLRPILGCYGENQIVSPNIDKLAEQSILFERAYAQVPICMPSRISILTGIHPLSNSFDINSKWAEIAYPNIETLPEYFKNNGYHTISNGKIFHEQEDSDAKSWSEKSWRPKVSTLDFLDEASEKHQKYSSYETYDEKLKGKKRVEGNRGPFVESPDVPDNAYPDGMILDKSIKDLVKLSEKEQPFFLAVGFNKPHLPFYAPKKYWDLYNSDSIEIASNKDLPKNAPKQLKSSREISMYHDNNLGYNSDEFHKEGIQGYYACVSYIDKLVGDLLMKVSELGLDENTIIVLWGDHGFHLGEHNMWTKHNTLNNALQTPLLFKIPGKVARRENHLAGLIDIYPTLCELADLDIPNQVQGKNLFRNYDEDKNENAVFMKWKNSEAVKTNQYLYTEWYNEKGITEQMLFDHFIDPDENHNVAYKKEYQSVVKSMRLLLENKRRELN